MSDLDDFGVTSTYEYGLALPNGEIVWPPAVFAEGYAIDTAEGRRFLVDALRNSAERMGFSEEDLLSKYSWICRERKVYKTTVLEDRTRSSIDASYILTEEEEDGEGPSNLKGQTHE